MRAAFCSGGSSGVGAGRGSSLSLSLANPMRASMGMGDDINPTHATDSLPPDLGIQRKQLVAVLEEALRIVEESACQSSS